MKSNQREPPGRSKAMRVSEIIDTHFGYLFEGRKQYKKDDELHRTDKTVLAKQ